MVSYSMSYAPVDGVLADMSSTYTAIRGILDGVSSAQLANLNIDTWTGHTPDTYRVCQAQWNQACDDLNMVLAQAHKTLDAMKENIMMTDNKVGQMFNH